MSDANIIKIFRDWLNYGHSGCHFASHAAGKAQLGYYVVSTEDPDAVDLDVVTAQVDQFADDRRVAVLLFPKMRGTTELIGLILHVRTHERWNVSRLTSAPASGAVAVGISHRTRHADDSIAMGFAPILEMPVTRRAPYVALALWAGPKSNEFFDKGPPGTVNMAHAWHPHTEEIHDRMWTTSKQATALRLAEPAFSAKWLYDVSFCLPSDVADAALA